MNRMRKDADMIIKEAIQKVLPDEAVSEALRNKSFGNGRIYVVAAGKAAWQMAKTAVDALEHKIEAGVVITKYDHVKGDIPNMKCYEAGHPIPDKNSFIGTQAAIDLVSDLRADDTVLFLLSGGGSALFEKPMIPEEELTAITNDLLKCGADIVEINKIRKRISAVKGGKFAKICEPAQVYSIVLSDILGDPLDMIASGPAYPDTSTCEETLEIVDKYQLNLSSHTRELLKRETPKTLTNVEVVVTGSVKNLCKAAEESCQKLGYETVFLTDQLNCEAKEAGLFLGAIAKSYQKHEKSIAFIAGGETIVHLQGKGKGGRNQELALAAADAIDGLIDTAVFSVGSDGTDGPTDAAGGFVDGTTKKQLNDQGVDIYHVLQDNNAYEALEKAQGLIITGATGTNVNDVSVVLIKR